MCKGTQTCTALGTDSTKWSREAPLPVPNFFEKAVEGFTVAVASLIDGKKEDSLVALEETNHKAVGEFFIEHGQQSAYFRVQNRLEIDKTNRIAKDLNNSPRLIPKVEKEVFERDSYRCRYCGLRIISKEVFTEYSRIVGSDNFSVERENSKRNGLTLGLRGVADHVEPYASGGETSIDNLVTSCYSCNFGKAGYTLEQIGIFDPRLKQPINDGWSGLTEFLPALREIKKVG
jgi:5-methylcytosine-specific restriction endonuclease McrA